MILAAGCLVAAMAQPPVDLPAHPFALYTTIPVGESYPGDHYIRVDEIYSVHVSLEWIYVWSEPQPYAVVRYINGQGQLGYLSLDSHTATFVALDE